MCGFSRPPMLVRIGDPHTHSGLTMLIANRPIAAVLAALATSGLIVLVDLLFGYVTR